MDALLNHLWQSTLLAAVIALLTLLLRKNRAAIRHALWLTASVKFLIPFSLLISIGNQIEWRGAPAAVATQISIVMEQFSEPFASPAGLPIAPNRWPTILLAIWAGGFLVATAVWLRRWHSLRRVLRSAQPLPLNLAIPVRCSREARLEPGVFGIFRPVLLLPAGIADRLAPAQFGAILAHELAHVRRRDNLTAAIHMLVEALFWFHPLVWWIERRMLEERERACDEEVLCATAEPECYAAGILEVCKLYLESPLVCVAGVTGSDLKKRIATIMTNSTALRLNLTRKLLLATAALAAIAVPILIGTTVRAQSTAEPRLVWDVISIKTSDPGSGGIRFGPLPGGGLRATGVPVHYLMEVAYDAKDFQIKGAPAWYRTDRFDILAKVDQPDRVDTSGDSEDPDSPAARRFRRRMQSLLEDRFGLSIRRETSEQQVYLLGVAKGGHKLQETDERGGLNRNFAVLAGRGTTIPVLANVLSSMLSRPVLDRTGLTGNYKFKLEFAPGPTTAASVFVDDQSKPETPADAAGPSIFSAIQTQVGLKLDAGKGPVETIVIERISKPSGN